MSDNDADTERLPGLLTPEQRRFIWEGPEEDLSPEAIRQQRYRIRQRVRNAFGDFDDLLFLSEDDRERIFDEAPDTREGFSVSNPAHTAFLTPLEFIHGGVGDEVFRKMVEHIIEVYVQGYLNEKKETLADANATITVETENERTADELKQKFDAGEHLTHKELGMLALHERISFEEAEAASADSPARETQSQNTD